MTVGTKLRFNIHAPSVLTLNESALPAVPMQTRTRDINARRTRHFAKGNRGVGLEPSHANARSIKMGGAALN